MAQPVRADLRGFVRHESRRRAGDSAGSRGRRSRFRFGASHPRELPGAKSAFDVGESLRPIARSHAGSLAAANSYERRGPRRPTVRVTSPPRSRANRTIGRRDRRPALTNGDRLVGPRRSSELRGMRTSRSTRLPPACRPNPVIVPAGRARDRPPHRAVRSAVAVSVRRVYLRALAGAGSALTSARRGVPSRDRAAEGAGDESQAGGAGEETQTADAVSVRRVPAAGASWRRECVCRRRARRAGARKRETEGDEIDRRVGRPRLRKREHAHPRPRARRHLRILDHDADRAGSRGQLLALLTLSVSRYPG